MNVTYEDPPALIRYDCERCKRGFVPPRPGRQMGLGGDARRVSVQADDEAYRKFAQSVHFCPTCRQFVCHECWATSRGTCQACAIGAISVPALPAWPVTTAFPVATALPLATTRPAAPALPVATPGLAFVRPAVSVASHPPVHRSRNAVGVALTGAFLLLLLGGGLVLAGLATGPSSAPFAAGTPTAAPSLDTATTTELETGASSSSPAAGDGESSPAPSSTSAGATPTRVGTPTRTPISGSTRAPTPTATRTATPTPTPPPTETTTPTPPPTPPEAAPAAPTYARPPAPPDPPEQ